MKSNFEEISDMDGFLSLHAFELFQKINNAINSKKIRILEIGVFCGKSLLGLALSFPNSIDIQGIDPFWDKFNKQELEGDADFLSEASHFASPKKRIYNILDSIHKLKNRISYPSLDNITLKAITQEQLLKKRNIKKYDLIHVDGEHTFKSVNTLIDNFHNLLNRDSLIIFDDILNPGYPGIAEAVFSNINFKKKYFPILYGFNKGLFLYSSSKVLLNKLQNRLRSEYHALDDFNVREFSDHSFHVDYVHTPDIKPRQASLQTKFISFVNKFIRH